MKFYYNYHTNKFGGRKAVLTKKILEFSDNDLPEKVKSCDNMKLTDYGIHFNLTKDNRIIVDHTCEEDEIIGPDTVYRLENGPKASNRDEVFDDGSGPTRSPIKRPKKKIISKLHDKKKRRRTKSKATPARKKRSQAPITPSPAKKKQARSTTRLSSTQKRQATSLRSSPRLSCNKTPSDSSHSSKPESDEDALEDGKDASGGELEDNKGLIDLCESSDDDDNGEYEQRNSTKRYVYGNNEISDDMGALKDENIILKTENADLKARVTVLETETASLDQEVQKLRAELEQSKRTLSVIKSRTAGSMSQSF